jgi:hypothetical protein
MNHPRSAEYMRARKKPNSYVQPSIFDVLAGASPASAMDGERRQTVDWSQQVRPSDRTMARAVRVECPGKEEG